MRNTIEVQGGVWVQDVGMSTVREIIDNPLPRLSVSFGVFINLCVMCLLGGVSSWSKKEQVAQYRGIKRIC